MSRVLVIDDTDSNRRLLSAVLKADGLEVELANDGETGVAGVAANRPDAVLLDLRMPGMGGMAALAKIREMAPALPVIVVSAHADIEVAVDAIKLGAFDFLVRPVPNAKLLLTVRRALEHGALKDEVRVLRAQIEVGGPLGQLIGDGPEMRAVAERIHTVATSNLSVLIQGETGTGKELVARAIHHLSARRAGPLVALDCGAIPEGLIESEVFGHEKGAFTGADRRKEGHFRLADGGTLFLDEIGNLPAQVQAKLLRVLQERRVQPLGATRPIAVDARVVAATHEDLDAAAVAGVFRKDLYYRLAEFTITLPPLRERKADIEALARHFVEEAAVELRRPVAGISDAAIALLSGLAWPGNVRQLRNVVRQAVLEAKDAHVEPADFARSLPASGRVAPELDGTGESLGIPLRTIAEHAAAQAEKRAIVLALRATGGNKSRAARLLKVDYKTLHTKMRRYGIGAMEPAP